MNVERIKYKGNVGRGCSQSEENANPPAQQIYFLPRGPVRRQKLSVSSVKWMVVEIPAPLLRTGGPRPILS